MKNGFVIAIAAIMVLWYCLKGFCQEVGEAIDQLFKPKS